MIVWPGKAGEAEEAGEDGFTVTIFKIMSLTKREKSLNIIRYNNLSPKQTEHCPQC